jgi:rSAM/selenodomain-associated transferase 1
VAYAPDGGTDGFETLDLNPSDLLAQRGHDLGMRQRSVFKDLFEAGHSKVLVIGSDLPTLPVSHIEDALSQIDDSMVVLGPSEDGGYYLMGLAAPRGNDTVPDLFTDIRWSTASTLEDTIRAAEQNGLTVSQVAPWYDIDTAEGLSRLQEDLRTAEHIQQAPETARTLRRITSR